MAVMMWLTLFEYSEKSIVNICECSIHVMDVIIISDGGCLVWKVTHWVLMTLWSGHVRRT